ncbi:MAG: hypothetical protein ACYS99_06790 [Planctomycetota bacterium]|jgi:hypothetical protein
METALRRTGSSFQRPLARLAVLLAVAAAAGVVIILMAPRTGHPPAPLPSVLEIQEDGLFYTYHVPTDSEALFDLHRDPQRLKNIIGSRGPDAAKLHRALERKLGIDDLRDLLDPADKTVEALRGLGYL